MAADDTCLGLELGRLEIEPIKPIKKETVENPFSNSLQKKSKISHGVKCSCMIQKRKSNKKKTNNVLKEPLLRLSQPYCKNISKTESDIANLSHTSQNINPDLLHIHSLVSTCNQLSISSDKRNLNMKAREAKDHSKWWKSRKSKAVNDRNNTKVETEKSSSTCSQQALNPPPPCDVTIDELASYFETFVHIPKKMSTMAEMMYI